MIKRILTLCLALCLTAACAAGLAEDWSRYTVASAVVSAAKWTDLTAPYSGVLMPFDVRIGDTVKKGDVLFRMQVNTLYAPENGSVTAVFARKGDDAAGVCAHFGGLMAIEGEHPFLINATTSHATVENRELRPGQTLYFRSERTGREEGSGRVIAVSGDNYVVEILSGKFMVRETMNLYRNADYTARTGIGTVALRNPVLITAAGRVADLLVSEHGKIIAGQPLATLLGPDADPGASSWVAAPADGVIALLGVQPGQQVWKGALLARIYHTGAPEIVADVDEMDLPRLKVGDTCPVVLDLDPDTVHYATVREIGGLGVTRQNAAYFTVRLTLNETDLPLGASASVYIPKN